MSPCSDQLSHEEGGNLSGYVPSLLIYCTFINRYLEISTDHQQWENEHDNKRNLFAIIFMSVFVSSDVRSSLSNVYLKNIIL